MRYITGTELKNPVVEVYLEARDGEVYLCAKIPEVGVSQRILALDAQGQIRMISGELFSKMGFKVHKTSIGEKVLIVS